MKKRLPDFSTLNAKGANDPMKRLETIQNMMKSTQASSPTGIKNIRLGELRTYRNKSVNVSSRDPTTNFHSITNSPMKDFSNDYDNAPPIAQ